MSTSAATSTTASSGREFGGGEVVIFAYRTDAKALYRVMEPGLRALAFRLARVVLRHGNLPMTS
ncbi:hypothetical protein ACWDR2_20355 [Streptomyces sp. NPDC003631]